MRLDELKKGFWGYKKESVYNYVVALEEEASKRLAEKNAQIDKLEAEAQRQRTELATQYERQIDKLKAEAQCQRAELANQYEEQIEKLKAEIAPLLEENEALRNNQDLVFATMLDAQKYADQLKTDSARQAQQARQELSIAVQQKNQQLDAYVKRIRQLRAAIRELLEDLDSKTGEMEKALVHLPAHAPNTDLSRQGSNLVILPEDLSAAAGAETATPGAEKTEKWNK